MTTPCWIPHANDLIKTIASKFKMCDTLEKYTCMLAMIQIAGDEVPWHCQKSCKAENYKIMTISNNIDLFTRVCS